MSAGADTAAKSALSVAGTGRLVALLRTHTVLVLMALLIVFVAGIEVAKPGTVTPIWVSNMFLFAAPLGILPPGRHW